MAANEENRATVLRFCESLSRRDYAGMAELATPDATWWVVGRPDLSPVGGLRSMPEVIKLIESVLGSCEEFTFTVQTAVCEGDRVAIEATSSGRNGAARYNNTYAMWYRLRENRIVSVREFFDVYEINAYLEQLQVAANPAPAGAG